MRTLSASLQSAQKSAAARPYLKVELDDTLPAVARPIFTRFYTGTEPEYHHSVYMPGDGSLIRARLDNVTERLYVQRVASPGASSNYSQWTYLNDAAKEANICLCGQGAQVLLFFVDTIDNLSIKYRESTDNGATWGAVQSVITPAQNGTLWLAADVKPSGVVALFYVTDDQTLRVMKRVGGSWDNSQAWLHASLVSTITGVSCIYGTDWDLVVCGQPPGGGYKVWTTVFGDGGDAAQYTWSSLLELTMAESGASMEFRNPFLGKFDTFRLFFIEKYSGTASYSRPLWSFTPPSTVFTSGLWREPVPFDLALTYGMALAGDGASLWLSTPAGVWRGSLLPAALDLSDDVLEAEVREEPVGGSATVRLRNDAGKYNNPEGGPGAGIRKGSRVRLSPGYITSAGTETSPGPTFWVQGWEHRSFEGGATFTLYMEDAWAILQRWRARRQYTWNLGQASVKDILAFILARAGLKLSIVSSSAILTTHFPSFTIHPGENGAQAMTRLMLTVPDVLFYRDGAVYSKYLQSTDPVDYSYGTDHPIFNGRFSYPAAPYNRIQTYGKGVMAEAFDWNELEKVADRLLQVHDLNLDTQTKAQQRSDSLRDAAARAKASGQMEAPVNCGQELYDLVQVTDSRCGLSAAKRRVLGLTLRYSRGSRPRYTHSLTLEGS